MKRRITFCAAALLAASSANGQDPIIDSWMLNTTGVATYDVGSGVVTMSDSADVTRVCYDANNVYVVAEGLANYQMGQFPSNPNTPAGQDFVWRFTRNAQAETGTHTAQPSSGALGAAVNGVALYGISDTRSYQASSGQNTPMGDGIWNQDAWISEGNTMDANGNGHPQQQGEYHYHANPISLYSDPSTSHSPIIGFAFDGYPIYGPFGYDDPLDSMSQIVRIETSYALRNITDRTTLPDGSPSTPPGPTLASYALGQYQEDYEYIASSGHLDEYNGRFCYTPDYPNGTYAYFISTESNGDPKFPYMIGMEYYGQVSVMDINTGSNATIPGSATNCITPQNVSVVDMEEVDFDIYPNPANEQVLIELDNDTYTIEIVDVTGKVISSTQSNGNTTISTVNYANGLYFVKVSSIDGTATSTTKLMVSH